jgi:hypothetical protein
MGNKISTRRILVGKCNPKRPLGIPGTKCDNITINLINREEIWAGFV